MVASRVRHDQVCPKARVRTDSRGYRDSDKTRIPHRFALDALETCRGALPAGILAAQGDERLMHRLDALDNRIIRELGSPKLAQPWNIRESYASIAKRVGASEETVRRRVRLAENRGVIQGWRVVVHPNVIAYTDVFLDLQVDRAQRKEEIIKLLRLVDSVVLITDFEGTGLFLLIYSELGDVLSRKVQLIRTICGADELVTWNTLLPPCGLKLIETDWRIIWAIRDDPRKSISKIAREVGVTTRTVNRRLTLLARERAFFLMGLPDFRQVRGTTANFLILLSDARGRASAAQKISSRFENITYQGVYDHVMIYDIAFPTLSEAEDAYRWIKRLKGVRSARFGIIKDLIVVNEWANQQVKRNLH